MLLAMAKGDAYGFGFEYAPADYVSANNTLTCFVKHPKHVFKPSVYSDDTQMSIAVAEVICSGQTITKESLAQSFVHCFKRDERVGYARGFYAFLQQVKDGSEFLALIKPDSDKSGGAMRALPGGIYPDIKDVLEFTALQASITHNTPGGIESAQAAALMSHYFLYNLGPKAELSKFIASHVPGQWTTPWLGPVGQKGSMSVHAAISAVERAGKMSQLLIDCVAYTGDVDTVAALAVGAASLSTEISQDLPDWLENDLENGAYGRDYLKTLDKKLMHQMSSLHI